MKNTSKGNTRKTRARRILALALTLLVALGTLAGCMLNEEEDEELHVLRVCLKPVVMLSV